MLALGGLRLARSVVNARRDYRLQWMIGRVGAQII